LEGRSCSPASANGRAHAFCARSICGARSACTLPLRFPAAGPGRQSDTDSISPLMEAGASPDGDRANRRSRCQRPGFAVFMQPQHGRYWLANGCGRPGAIAWRLILRNPCRKSSGHSGQIPDVVEQQPRRPLQVGQGGLALQAHRRALLAAPGLGHQLGCVISRAVRRAPSKASASCAGSAARQVGDRCRPARSAAPGRLRRCRSLAEVAFGLCRLPVAGSARQEQSTHLRPVVNRGGGCAEAARGRLAGRRELAVQGSA